MIMYHLTKKEHLEGIKTNGLIPSMGKNSSKVSEDRKNVFLTEEKFLNIWGHFLHSNVVIKLDIDEKDIVDAFEYDYYSEKLTNHIPAKKILEIKDFLPTVDKVCLNVFKGIILDLSSFALGIVRNYYDIINSDIPEKEKDELLESNIENIYFQGIEWWLNLNISIKKILGEENVREIFEAYGRNGVYTLFDYNIANDILLINDLSNVKLPSQSKILILNKYIESLHKEFDFCGDLCTGGWE